MSEPRGPGGLDLAQDYFRLFGVERRFGIDLQTVEIAYLALQSEVHPDRHVTASEGDRRRAMQWATRVNEAWRTLKAPLARAVYLLQLAGVDVALETNTAMSPEFLIEQMEWREAVESAREGGDGDELVHLMHRLEAQKREMGAELAHAIDEAGDLDAAAELVRRLKFIEKLETEIEDALEALES